MARGFNTTLGAGSTDMITSAYAGATPTLLTIIALVNRRVDNATTRRIYSQEGAVGDFGSVLDHVSATASYNLQIDYGVGGVTSGEWRMPRPAAGAWAQIAVTIDNSSAANDPLMYINGVSQTVTEVLAPSGTRNVSTVWAVGNRPADQIRVWDGMIAEFGILTRIVSPTELAFLNPSAGVWRSGAFLAGPLAEYIPMISLNSSLTLAAPTIVGTAVQTHPSVLHPHNPRLSALRNRLVRTP